MVAVAVILLLFGLSSAVAVYYRLKPDFRFFWLILSAGAAVSWLVLLASGLRLPQEITLINWGGMGLPLPASMLRLDNISWPFAAALGALLLALLLSTVIRADIPYPIAWAANAAVTAVGLLAVMADDPLLVLLSWAAMDVVEVLVLLGQITSSEVRERVVVSFTARAASLLLVIAATLAAHSRGWDFTFATVPADLNTLFLIAAGLRLGVLPLHVPFIKDVPIRRGLGTMLRLAPAAASIALLARCSLVGVAQEWQVYLLLLGGLATLYGGIAWAFAENELDGRQFWVLSMAGMAVAAAVRAMPQAVVAWGMAAILPGAMLLLASVRTRVIFILLAAAMLLSIGLPFSPGWSASAVFAAPFSMWMVLYLLAQGFLWAGYLRHARSQEQLTLPADPSARILYPVGLVIPFLTLFAVAWAEGFAPEIQVWWSGPLSLLLVIAFFFGGRAGITIPASVLATFRMFFSFSWIYRLFWWGYRFTARLVALSNRILEGEGGFLWAVLLLVILLSILFQALGAEVLDGL